MTDDRRQAVRLTVTADEHARLSTDAVALERAVIGALTPLGLVGITAAPSEGKVEVAFTAVPELSDTLLSAIGRAVRAALRLSAGPIRPAGSGRVQPPRGKGAGRSGEKGRCPECQYPDYTHAPCCSLR